MAVHRDVVFERTLINFDDNEYIGCTFNACSLVYSGGVLPTLQNNTFDGCSWEFAGAAQRTLQFLNGLYVAGATEIVEGTMRNIREFKENNAKIGAPQLTRREIL